MYVTSATGRGLFLQECIFYSLFFFIAFAINFSAFLVFYELANCAVALLSDFRCWDWVGLPRKVSGRGAEGALPGTGPRAQPERRPGFILGKSRL